MSVVATVARPATAELLFKLLHVAYIVEKSQ